MIQDSIGFILLAGGIGSRMGSLLPKQFLMLQDKPIALHSLETFSNYAHFSETIVVCAKEHRFHFKNSCKAFATPGPRRQDSLYNGLQQLSKEIKWVCVHDAARPFVTLEMIEKLIEEGKKAGASALAVPVKSTLKETGADGLVCRTLMRDQIWEVQTPQFVAREVLEKGFARAMEQGITVTDDVSLAELVGHPVKLIFGGYQNIKITTPEDLIIAQCQIKNTK